MSIGYSYRKELMNKKVFLRSNEDENLIVGEIINFETFGGSTFPVVRCNTDGKAYRGGLVFPYSKAMERVLGVLNPKEQWDYLVEIVQTIRAVDHVRVNEEEN